MKRLISANVATMVATSTVLFGLTLLSLTSPSMAQQQGAEQTTTDITATTPPSANATTTISLQDLTNNQSITEPIDSFTITQQWSPMLFIDPGAVQYHMQVVARVKSPSVVAIKFLTPLLKCYLMGHR